MMSLGAGALKVSRGPNAISREEVSMATLEAGPPQEQPLTGTVTLNKFSGDTYLRESLRQKILTKPPGRGGGGGGGGEEREQESAMIRK